MEKALVQIDLQKMSLALYPHLREKAVRARTQIAYQSGDLLIKEDPVLRSFRVIRLAKVKR